MLCYFLKFYISKVGNFKTFPLVLSPYLVMFSATLEIAVGSVGGIPISNQFLQLFLNFW